jgi:hypothetical protein
LGREDKIVNCTFAAQTVKRMSVVLQIKASAAKAINELYNFPIEEVGILVNATKPEFEGDYTLVMFSFVKATEEVARNTWTGIRKIPVGEQQRIV